jgi:hypothetical protein
MLYHFARASIPHLITVRISVVSWIDCIEWLVRITGSNPA